MGNHRASYRWNTNLSNIHVTLSLISQKKLLENILWKGIISNIKPTYKQVPKNIVTFEIFSPSPNPSPPPQPSPHAGREQGRGVSVPPP